MAKKDARTIQTELARPFAPEDLEWRLQRVFESRGETIGIAVPFVTNRAIMNRLDSVVGPENWYNDFKPWHAAGKKEAQLCGIAIYFEERKEWIMKWDGAEDSDIEPIKGGLSDSMKRAAVQWGIGRCLYSMDTVFVDVEQRGKSSIIKKGERAKLDKAYTDLLKALKLEPAPAGGVQSLLIDGEPGDTAQDTKPSGPPAIPRKDAPSSAEKPQGKAKKREPEPEAMPEAAYVVTAAKMQKGMTTTNTQVKIKNAEGKEISAFAQGEHPMLKPGTRLSEIKLVQRCQDTVVYYVLESYKLAEQPQRAA